MFSVSVPVLSSVALSPVSSRRSASTSAPPLTVSSASMSSSVPLTLMKRVTVTTPWAAYSDQKPALEPTEIASVPACVSTEVSPEIERIATWSAPPAVSTSVVPACVVSIVILSLPAPRNRLTSSTSNQWIEPGMPFVPLTSRRCSS